MRRDRSSPDFGEWLDITLSNRGIQGRGLAERLGVNDATVSRWRSGKSVPSLEIVRAIAEVLELDAPRLALTAGVVPLELVGPGIEPYPMPEPTARRESVRRQIARIHGLSDEGRNKLLQTYDEITDETGKG